MRVLVTLLASVRANIGDISNYLNASGMANSPFKNITLSGDGDQIKLTGTLHKRVSLPVELAGTIGALPDNRIQIHVTKLNVLKFPSKLFLGACISPSLTFSIHRECQVWKSRVAISF